MKAVNQVIERKEAILDSVNYLKEKLTNTEALEKERDKLGMDLNLLTDKVQQLIAENARVAQNQDEYARNYDELVGRYEAIKSNMTRPARPLSTARPGANSWRVSSMTSATRNPSRNSTSGFGAAW